LIGLHGLNGEVRDKNGCTLRVKDGVMVHLKTFGEPVFL
jgi:hypothetical protein